MTTVTHLPNAVTREKWVQRIATAWKDQVTAIFETGNLLEAAKAELKHGEWMKMVKEELPFSQSQANRLMKIADDDKLRNSAHVPNLPASWGTLFELTKLTDEQFEHGIESGAINPKMQRKDIAALRGLEQPHKDIGQPSSSIFSLVDQHAMKAKKLIVASLKLLTPDEQKELIEVIRFNLDDLETQRKGKHENPTQGRTAALVSR